MTIPATLQRRALLGATAALGLAPGLFASSTRDSAGTPLRLALIERPATWDCDLREPAKNPAPGGRRQRSSMLV